MYKIEHNLCPRTIWHVSDQQLLKIYGRKIFVNLVLTQLRTENTQFDT